MPQTLLPLEHTLWHPATCYNRALMDATFAPDFHEFGRSGRGYTRDDLLFDAADARPIDATLRDFKVTLLTPTLAHCTYVCECRTQDRTEWSNRASLWDRASGRWQLRFHQGTPTNSAKST